MNYQFLEQKKQEFPIVVMCRVLDVSESGFYACRRPKVGLVHQSDRGRRVVFASLSGTFSTIWDDREHVWERKRLGPFCDGEVFRYSKR